MGGKPLFALNISALPAMLPLEMMQSIIRGAAEKALEAGVVIAGGHSVKDDEPKFGLVALGIVQNDQLLTKSGANLATAFSFPNRLVQASSPPR